MTQKNLINVGHTIRALRRERNMTGAELGKRSKMSQSKISKIETGFYAQLIPREIEAILDILEVSVTIQQQVLATLKGAGVSRGVRRVRYQIDLEDVLQRERTTSLLRSFAFNGPHVLLQNLEYHQALMAGYTDDSLNLNLTAKRQDLLWDRQHKYHFIMHESALYSAPSTSRIQIAQLDRLDRFIGCDGLKIGILPLENGLPSVENGGFVIYDNRLTILVASGNELEIDDPSGVAEQIGIFKMLDKRACYGDEARKHIHKALKYFS